MYIICPEHQVSWQFFHLQKVQLLRDENKAVLILSQHYTRFSPLDGQEEDGGTSGEKRLIHKALVKSLMLHTTLTGLMLHTTLVCCRLL